MATYCIGDLQGCLEPLLRLLSACGFSPGRDRLWFVGDLVNRGPRSLDTLRFVKALGENADVVLGNHDLHLLAAAAGLREPARGDTLQEILGAPDRDQLLEWLRHRPLLHADEQLGFAMVHAGIPPRWSIAEATVEAARVAAVLRAKNYRDFLANMYGNAPATWSSVLAGHSRHRFTVNGLTRMRYCRADGSLDLDQKKPPGQQPRTVSPWFTLRQPEKMRIVFGHWASLQAERRIDSSHGVFHVDQGCVWGGRLMALRLDDLAEFSVAGWNP